MLAVSQVVSLAHAVVVPQVVRLAEVEGRWGKGTSLGSSLVAGAKELPLAQVVVVPHIVPLAQVVVAAKVVPLAQMFVVPHIVPLAQVVVVPHLVSLAQVVVVAQVVLLAEEIVAALLVPGVMTTLMILVSALGVCAFGSLILRTQRYRESSLKSAKFSLRSRQFGQNLKFS